jgi:hypothetical protein
MNCLSRRAEVDVPVTPAFPAPMVPALPTPALPIPPVSEQVAVLEVAGKTVGIVGSNELGPTVPTTGNTPVVGTAGAELTPRLPISIEPNGIPVRATPPGVVGADDVAVGADDEAMLLEPEPHIPDIPDVPSIPRDVDIPDGTDISDDVDVPGVAVGSVDAAVGSIPVVPGVAMLPAVAAVAGLAVPAAVPPPSKLAVDPNIPDGDIPPVEHVVPLVVIAPLVGIAIVPVTLPVGAGLTPSDVISVEPIGMPVGPTDASGPIPNGEVTPSEGVAVSGSSTWANAGLQPRRADTVAVTNKRLIDVIPD